MKPISMHERPARPAGPSTSKKGSLPIGASVGSGRCQVGTGTDSPCGRPAATEVLGVLFCERCAREQEDYFAIGELTQAPRGRIVVAGSLGHDTKMPHSRAGVKRRRRSQGTVAKRGKIPFLLVVLVLASALAPAACGGAVQTRGESAVPESKAEQERDAKERPRTTETTAGGNETERVAAQAGGAGARAGGAAARADDAKGVAGYAEARAGSVATTDNNSGTDAQEGNVEEKNGPQKVTLRITGEPGTRFSGACFAGGDERALDGKIPHRYAFDLGGETLECEIRTQGEGALEMVLTDGDSARSVQRIGVGEGTVRFAYSGGGVSSSFSSVYKNQKTVTSSGGSSSDGSP